VAVGAGPPDGCVQLQLAAHPSGQSAAASAHGQQCGAALAQRTVAAERQPRCRVFGSAGRRLVSVAPSGQRLLHLPLLRRLPLEAAHEEEVRGGGERLGREAEEGSKGLGGLPGALLVLFRPLTAAAVK